MDFETILMMSQAELKNELALVLKREGYPQIKNQKGFVYAPGTIPVLLVAHLDTVHRQSVRNILYSKDGSLMMSPEGIGGDDRAGVFAILQIIKQSRCHVLFCEDEETGGRGAYSFTHCKIRPQVNYIIELDRRGANDAVFYNCDNPNFTAFVCGFGFRKEFGTFSDISIIAPHLGVAAANISTGYYFEHTQHEVINVTDLHNSIERVCRMVKTPTGGFEYVEGSSFSRYEQMGYMPLRSYRSVQRRQSSATEMMPLPDTAFIKVNGRVAQALDSHFVDEDGRVYNYLCDLDAAVLSENTMAYSESGQRLRFNEANSQEVNVISIEAAIEKMNADI